MLMRFHVKVQNSLTRKEEGATLVEYGLMVALIAIVCIAAVTFLGTRISAMFHDVRVDVNAAAS